MRKLMLPIALLSFAALTPAAKTPKQLPPPKPPKVATPRPGASSAKADFRRSHACPATGRNTGSCPGYVISYLTPLVCGGADTSLNMQWLTTDAAKAANKDAKARCEAKAR